MTRLTTDLGGLPAGEIPRADEPMLFWQKQLVAVFNLLWKGGYINLDEFRRRVEEFPPDVYARSSLYWRRLEGLVGVLVEKGIISAAELDVRAGKILAERGGRNDKGA